MYEWIPHGAVHRIAWHHAVDEMSSELPEFEHIKSVPADLWEWICDLCNGLVPAMAMHGEGPLPIAIPVTSGYAVCPSCMVQIGYEKWLGVGWCQCPGCQAWLGAFKLGGADG